MAAERPAMAASKKVVLLTGWSGAGKSTTGDYLGLYHGFYHLDGDNIMRKKDAQSAELTKGLVRAFYEYWFRNLPAPSELWKPYIDALADQCIEAAKSHEKIALSFSVYRREARDYFREKLTGMVFFIRLDCDPDIVIADALGRVEKYMALRGKSVQDWWQNENKVEKYGEYSYQNYKRMQFEEFLSGMEPFSPDEEDSAVCDVSARGADALKGVAACLSLQSREEPDMGRLKEFETARLEGSKARAEAEESTM